MNDEETIKLTIDNLSEIFQECRFLKDEAAAASVFQIIRDLQEVSKEPEFQIISGERKKEILEKARTMIEENKNNE